MSQKAARSWAARSACTSSCAFFNARASRSTHTNSSSRITSSKIGSQSGRNHASADAELKAHRLRVRCSGLWPMCAVALSISLVAAWHMEAGRTRSTARKRSSSCAMAGGAAEDEEAAARVPPPLGRISAQRLRLHVERQAQSLRVGQSEAGVRVAHEAAPDRARPEEFNLSRRDGAPREAGGGLRIRDGQPLAEGEGVGRAARAAEASPLRRRRGPRSRVEPQRSRTAIRAVGPVLSPQCAGQPELLRSGRQRLLRRGPRCQRVGLPMLGGPAVPRLAHAAGSGARGEAARAGAEDAPPELIRKGRRGHRGAFT
eukprot:1355533-Prymnesium_polylepis.2